MSLPKIQIFAFKVRRVTSESFQPRNACTFDIAFREKHRAEAECRRPNVKRLDLLWYRGVARTASACVRPS